MNSPSNSTNWNSSMIVQNLIFLGYFAPSLGVSCSFSFPILFISILSLTASLPVWLGGFLLVPTSSCHHTQVPTLHLIRGQPLTASLHSPSLSYCTLMICPSLLFLPANHHSHPSHVCLCIYIYIFHRPTNPGNLHWTVDLWKWGHNSLKTSSNKNPVMDHSILEDLGSQLHHF